MEYVTDTHAILWHLFAPQRLGSSAKLAFDEADSGRAKIYIPAIVLSEMIMVIEKKRIVGIILSQLLTVIASMKKSKEYIVMPLFPDTVIASHELTIIPDI